MTLKQGLAWAPLSNPTVCSQAWPPICCLSLGQSYLPGCLCPCMKRTYKLGGLQGSRQPCEGKRQFPPFFFDNTLQWSLKTTLQKTFMSLLPIFRKRAVMWPVQGDSSQCRLLGPVGRHWRVSLSGPEGSHPGPTPLHFTSLSLDIPTCKMEKRLPPEGTL